MTTASRLFGALLVCASLPAIPAPAATEWNYRFGGTSDQFALDVDMNAAGHVAVVGNFDGSISFGGDNFTGSTDMFVAVFEPDGTHLWSRDFNAAGQQTVRSVDIDAAGDVVITGYFTGSVDFGGGALAALSTDIFVAKYDHTGAHVWSRHFGDANTQRGRCVVVDEAGAVYLGGEIAGGSADLGGGALGVGLFVAKLDADGNHVWSRACDGLGGQVEDVNVADSGGVVFVGSFQGSASFGGSALLSAGGTDAFVAAYQSDGVHAWSLRAGDGTNQVAKALGIDATGDVTVVGDFDGSADFGGGALASAGSTDIFVVRLSGAGAHEWSRRFGDVAAQVVSSAAVEPDGEIVVTGFFSGTLDFGGAPLVSSGVDDIFVAKFDADGDEITSQQFGDASATARFYGLNIASNGDDAVVFGEFFGAIDFGLGALNSAGGRDVFLTRFEFVSATGIGDGPNPGALALRNHPNPFNPSTTILFELASAGSVSLVIYDARGARVRTLARGSHDTGRHGIDWNGRDERGQTVSSGVYFARLEFDGDVAVHKLALIK